MTCVAPAWCAMRWCAMRGDYAVRGTYMTRRRGVDAQRKG